MRLLVDLGYRQFSEQSIRLAGITAPRIYRVEQEEREQGLIAKEFVIRWFERHGKNNCGGNGKWPYNIRSISSDAFGRYLGEIECLQGHLLNDDILLSGYAKPYRKDNGS